MVPDEARRPGDREPRERQRRRDREPGRAGRNLPVAIAVSLLLGALILASLYIIKVAFVGVAAVAVGIAVWEISHAMGTAGIRVPVVPILMGTLAMLVGAYFRGSEALIVLLAFTALAIIVWRLPEGHEGYLRDVSAGIFVAVYAPFLAGFAMLLLAGENGAHRVIIFIVLAVCSDTAGYAVGVLFGRHPMAPQISPKKTWEGFSGAAITCMGAGAALVVILLSGEIWQGVVLGAVAVCSASLGDLSESMIKRDLGIKDMGVILPGHGGFMERLDSLLPSAPIVWLLLTVFFPPS